MKLFRLLVVSLTLAACGGGEDPPPADTAQPSDTGGGNACTNADYDPCTDNTQCTSGNCHLFQQSGFQVCSPACTAGDNTTCPVDSSGANGQCNNMGICKPLAANDCTR